MASNLRRRLAGAAGILFSNSYGELCSNRFDNIGYAMQFQGDCTKNDSVGSVLALNVINSCEYGVVLRNIGLTTPGIIGQQGDSTLTHGNSFIGPFNNTDCNTSDSCRTFCFSSNGVDSPFRVNNTVSDEPKYNGTDVGSGIQRGHSTTTTPWNCSVMKNSFFADSDTSHRDKWATSFEVKVFPNPANTTIEIVADKGEGSLLLEIYSMIGQTVDFARINENSSFDISSLEEGLYLLKFTSSQGVHYSCRLVVLR